MKKIVVTKHLKKDEDFYAIVNAPASGKYIDMRALRKSVYNLTNNGVAVSVEQVCKIICNEQLPDMDSEELCRYLTNKFKEK